MTANVNDYTQRIDCLYKGERYSVRDNGAVLRHAREGKLRPTDNKWTFGKLNEKTGYLEIASVRVHRIVATAFSGEPTKNEDVVDHIDTNKQNNRPENLRWVTRLENVLLNPITARRIELVCGSIEAFLADPSKFRDKFPDPNYEWMCAVSREEAQTSKKRLLAWASSDKQSSGMKLDDWIFRSTRNSFTGQETTELTIADTPNAVQKNWKTPSLFPCCPIELTDQPIYSYCNNLQIGKIFSRNKYTTSLISDYTLSEDNTTLLIMCSATADSNAIKPWSLAQVTYENDVFVHENLGSFFKKVGVEKEFMLAQGLEWTGEEVFDDLV